MFLPSRSFARFNIQLTKRRLIERSIFQCADEPRQDRESLTTQTLPILGTKICIVGPLRALTSLDCNVPEGLKIVLAPMKHSHDKQDKEIRWKSANLKLRPHACNLDISSHTGTTHRNSNASLPLLWIATSVKTRDHYQGANFDAEEETVRKFT